MDSSNYNKLKECKSIALLAPSFPIDFSYPNIIGMLKELGFDKVTELTFGARMVNRWYADYIKDHIEQKYFIASPCPTLVNFIKVKYPDLVKYLMPCASPMLAQARIIRKHYPEYLNVFISPCLAKQSIEAPLHKDVIDEVLVFQDLKEIFDHEKISSEDFNREYQFDSLIQEYTKVYPVSGGLANTSHLTKLFKPSEIFIGDTLNDIVPILDILSKGKSEYRFLDILNCKGGCIGGPGIINQGLTTEEKKAKVLKYVEEASDRNLGRHAGRLGYADDVQMEVSI